MSYIDNSISISNMNKMKKLHESILASKSIIVDKVSFNKNQIKKNQINVNVKI